MSTTKFVVVGTFCGKEWAWHHFSFWFPPVCYEIAPIIGIEVLKIQTCWQVIWHDWQMPELKNKRLLSGTGSLIMALIIIGRICIRMSLLPCLHNKKTIERTIRVLGMENNLAWHSKINSKFLVYYVGDEDFTRTTIFVFVSTFCGKKSAWWPFKAWSPPVCNKIVG